jgi:hypothetical protein
VAGVLADSCLTPAPDEIVRLPIRFTRYLNHRLFWLFTPKFGSVPSPAPSVPDRDPTSLPAGRRFYPSPRSVPWFSGAEEKIESSARLDRWND